MLWFSSDVSGHIVNSQLHDITRSNSALNEVNERPTIGWELCVLSADTFPLAFLRHGEHYLSALNGFGCKQSGYVHVIHEDSDDNYMKYPYYTSTNRTKLKPYTQHKSVSFQSTSFEWQLIRRFLNIKAVFCTWKLYFKTKRNKNTFLSTFVCECYQHNTQ